MIGVHVTAIIFIILLQKLFLLGAADAQECDAEYMYFNKMVHIPDAEVPSNTSDKSRAMKTIPAMYAKVAKSKIPNAGLGVFSVGHIPKGYMFGPYDGIYRSQYIKLTLYSWGLNAENVNPAITHVDAADPATSNWLRYVNCARHKSEQNLMTIEIDGHKYYWSCKDILPGTELLVYYGHSYAQILNIDTDNYYRTLKKPLKDDTSLPDPVPQSILLLGMPVFAIYLPVVVRQCFAY